MPEVCVRARRRRAETQHAGETLAPVLIVYVGEVGVTYAADVLGEAIMTDGQRPLAGSAERLLGREIRRSRRTRAAQVSCICFNRKQPYAKGHERRDGPIRT